MPYFRTVGTVPRKRHTQFRQASGELYYEEMIGEEGFSSTFSLLYHRGVPAAFSGSDDWPLPDQALTQPVPLRPADRVRAVLRARPVRPGSAADQGGPRRS